MNRGIRRRDAKRLGCALGILFVSAIATRPTL
jgi:hypothetical protein